jgi:two-component system nitrate/nitrite response regulator NarL
MVMDKIKIIAVCSNEMYRRGIVQTLQNTSHIEVLTDLANGKKALELVRKLKPNITMIGKVIEGLNSIELTSEIKKIRPCIKVVACANSIDVKNILSMLRAGADGYLLENIKPETFIAAISAVNAGESVLDPLILRALVRQSAGVPEDLKNSSRHILTDTELQIIKLGAKGLVNKEIAKELNMSVSSIKAHWAAIFSKINVNTRSQAVFHSIRDGWLLIDDMNES